MTIQPCSTLLTAALPDLSGTVVPLSRFRGRLALALFMAGDGSAHDALREMSALEPEMRRWGAEALLVVAAPPVVAAELARELRWGARTLLDTDDALHRRLGAVGAAGHPRPALLILDRGGDLRYRLDPPAGCGSLTPTDREEAVEWARYLGIQEPECGTCVPAWPAELMEEHEGR